MRKFGLTNNQLKIIAMVAMAMDHAGVMLFPQLSWLRIVGRLAFPIYAFMIAEGCRHTRNMFRYFGSVFALAAVCQIVYYFATGSLYMSILVTFSLSILMAALLKQALQRNNLFWDIVAVAGVGGVFFVCRILPGMLPGTDFYIDYGFIGVMIPVCLFAAREHVGKMIIMTLGLVCMATLDGGFMWYSLLAVPLLMLYNGKRGKAKMKWFFYLFYPVHLLIIQLIAYFF